MPHSQAPLFISFPFDIPAPSSPETKRLARGFAEDSLNVFVHSIQDTFKKQLSDHAISETAAYQSAMQLMIEFVKNTIDAGATKLTINLHFDPTTNKTHVFFNDNGKGMKAEMLGSYDVQMAMLKSSDKTKAGDVYGGAGLGNAMAAHYNEKYGAAAPGQGLIRRNQYDKDGSIAGALIILESSNRPCHKEIVTDGGEYLDEMQQDLMNALLDKFGQTGVTTNFSGFKQWLKEYRKNTNPEKSLAIEFTTYAHTENETRIQEAEIIERQSLENVIVNHLLLVLVAQLNNTEAPEKKLDLENALANTLLHALLKQFNHETINPTLLQFKEFVRNYQMNSNPERSLQTEFKTYLIRETINRHRPAALGAVDSGSSSSSDGSSALTRGGSPSLFAGNTPNSSTKEKRRPSALALTSPDAPSPTNPK